METKPWWDSTTIWMNVLAVVGTLSAAWGLDLNLTPEVQSSIVGGVLALLNIIWRFRTKSAIK